MYVELFAVVHFSVVSLSFSLSSGEVLSSELSVLRRWRVIFAYGIFSVKVSAKFLQNFLPLKTFYLYIPRPAREVLLYTLVLGSMNR